MTDCKTPSSSSDGMAWERLFDRECLSDSDSEFLTDLDQVLTADSGGQTVRSEMEKTVLRTGSRSEDTVLEDAVDPPDLDRVEIGSVKTEGVSVRKPDATVLAKIPESASEQPAPAASAEIPEKAPEDTEPESLAEIAALERQDEAELQGINDIINAYRQETETPALATAATGESRKAFEETGERLVAEAPASADEDGEIERGELQVPAEEAVEVPAAVGAFGSAATPARSATGRDVAVRGPEAPVTEAVEQARNDGSARWIGAVAVLGLLGVGMGGAGLWQVGNMEERLGRGEARSRVIAAPADDTKSVENAQRIGDLEQRVGWNMERMRTNLEALSVSLAEELERRNERLDGDLSALNATLSALQVQLQSARMLMAETRATGDRPANKPDAPPSEFDQSVQTTEPPAEDATVSALSVSTAGGKTPGWSVNLLAADRQDKAQKKLAWFRAQNVPAEIFSVTSKGKVWYRIAVGGFDSFDRADAYAETLRAKPGMSSVWVGRN